MKATRLFEAALYATNLDEAERFYREVLGLEVISRFGRLGLALRCGDAVLLLFDPERSRVGAGDVPPHGAIGQGHVAFPAAADEFVAWRRHLEACGVPIESEVSWPGGNRSIYFRDPAGNVLELATPHLWGPLED